MARRTKRLDHRPLLEDPIIRTWYDENRLRSSRTADVNLRQLGLCLHQVGLTPAGILKEAREEPQRLRQRLVHYASGLQSRGRLNSYIAKTFVGVSSFLRHNEVDFHGFPRLSVVRGESIENERVPTSEELAKLLRALPLRGQVSALLMAHSGLRPGVFSIYLAEETALTLGDIPELDIETLQFRKLPFLIKVPGSLSKNRKSYVTFGSSELAETLVSYLKERQTRNRWKAGRTVPPETLSRESPVVAVRDTETDTGFVSVKALTAELRKAIAKVVPSDTEWRPYVLRSYASTQLLLAEAKGKITRDFREAILGHDLGVSGRYNLSKKLQPSMVEEMRSAFARCEPFLATTGRAPTPAEEIQREAAVLLLTGFKGMKEEQARNLVEGKSGEDLANLLKPADASDAAKPREKAVSIEDVPGLLDSGWELVAALNGTTAVLREPLYPRVATG